MSCFIYIDKGIPNMLAQQNCGITSIPSSSIPSLVEAVSSYEQHQGVLTRFSMFGTDPLAEREDLIRRRDHLFQKNNPNFDQLFTSIVSSDGQMFLHALLNFKELTERLVNLI